MLIAVSSFGESLRRAFLTAPAEAVLIPHKPLKGLETEGNPGTAGTQVIGEQCPRGIIFDIHRSMGQHLII